MVKKKKKLQSYFQNSYRENSKRGKTIGVRQWREDRGRARAQVSSGPTLQSPTPASRDQRLADRDGTRPALPVSRRRRLRRDVVRGFYYGAGAPSSSPRGWGRAATLGHVNRGATYQRADSSVA